MSYCVLSCRSVWYSAVRAAFPDNCHRLCNAFKRRIQPRGRITDENGACNFRLILNFTLCIMHYVSPPLSVHPFLAFRLRNAHCATKLPHASRLSNHAVSSLASWGTYSAKSLTYPIHHPSFPSASPSVKPVKSVADYFRLPFRANLCNSYLLEIMGAGLACWRRPRLLPRNSFQLRQLRLFIVHARAGPEK
jgi:hypothetical protein